MQEELEEDWKELRREWKKLKKEKGNDVNHEESVQSSISQFDLWAPPSEVGWLADDRVDLESPYFVIEQVGFHPQPNTTWPGPITGFRHRREIVYYTSN